MEIHPIFGVMGAKKKKGAESTRMGYSLTFSSTACFTRKHILRSPASAKVTAPGCFAREELREPPSKVHSYSSAP